MLTRTAVFAAMIALGALTFAAPSQATTFIVDALANSSSGGVGAATIGLTAGEHFTVNVGPTDLWSAGALPRWSNANGLTGPDLIATGHDDSLEPAGTVIGSSVFGLYSQGGLTAPFGALVGEIAGGPFFLVGTSFSGIASATGTLNLFYWDSNFADNTQFISANVSAVPEVSTWAMMLFGFAGIGLVACRRNFRSVRFA